MFIIENGKDRNTARAIEKFDKRMVTEHKIIDKKGKCIIKKMDADTFFKKFG